ncbi:MULTISPECIES: glycosyltransferase [unclassified Luteococcus]|uniref:glycosyltransferase n=1 Tax=unclassified Luteococcus TaxID=2639923 RepID=UPI00313B602E
MSTEKPRVLVVAFDVFEKSTRARKYCRVYRSSEAHVQYLGMSSPGRSGRWGEAGSRIDDGVVIEQVAMRPPSGGTSKGVQARNLTLSYIPALSRMAKFLWRHPADVVHVVGAPLALLGILHRMRHRSRFVLDVQERPGAVATPGSLSSLFAHTESAILRLSAQFASAATVVTPPDVNALRHYGFSNIALVRNAPLTTWRSPYRPPNHPRPVTTFACIGTIFEGRSFEALIDATAELAKKVPIRVAISGTGSEKYLSELRDRAANNGADASIDWLGWVSADEVCDRYLDADVGIAFYDTAVSGNDGLSNKIMECVAAGRPVLCTNAPLNSQFINELKVGWTTASDATSIAATMEEIARQSSLVEIAGHCRNVGDTQLNWEAEFAPILQRVLGEEMQEGQA